MHIQELKQKVTLPGGVSAHMNGFMITLKGPKGELSKRVATKRVEVKVEGSTVTFVSRDATRTQKRNLMTGAAHLRNMIRGVTEGHTYKLKVCSSHFPMSVTIKGDQLEVKNFIGEAVPRTLRLLKGADVKIQGTEITVTSVNKELAGNQASAIELLTRRPGFDNRVFQDGIYITEKDGRQV